MTEAETERTAIVAWLRWERDQNENVAPDHEGAVSAWRFARACHILADAIERGEHLTSEGK